MSENKELKLTGTVTNADDLYLSPTPFYYQPYRGNDLMIYPVLKAVNNVRNDVAELIKPVE